MPITKLLYSFIENGPLTGSLFGTASYALDSVYSASLASRSTILESASGSFSTRVTNLVTDSGSFSTRAAALEIASGSFSTRITNLVSDSGSFSTRITNLVTDSSSFSTRTATLETASGSFSTRVTNLVSDSSSFSARLSSYTGSIFGTASYATKAETLVSGININAGLITASAISVTTLNVVTVTSSIEYASGSNIFGTKSTDTQLFTGSVSITGSLTVNGTVTATSSYSSLAATASYFAGVTNGTTNYVAKFTSANVLGTSSIFESGSSVGIGTVTPNKTGLSTMATVNGVTNSGYEVAVGDTRIAGLYASSTVAVLNAFANVPMQFSTNNTTRMTIDTSGNVGIGVTPSSWDTTYKAIELGRIGNTVAGYNGGTEVNIAANAYYSAGWKYAVSTAATRYMTDNSGKHMWFTAASGTAGNAITFTQAMTLDASGNLGIGVTSNTATLDVNTPGTTNYQNVANFFQSSQPDSQLMSISIGQSAANGKEGLIGFYKGTSAASYANSYMALNIFGDSWGSGLVLAKGGFVGIGTTSPIARLDVNGSINFGSANGSCVAVGTTNTFTPSGGNPTAYYGMTFGGFVTNSISLSGYNGIAMYTGAGVERVRIDSSGNVGIGTASPVEKLDVTGTNASSGISVNVKNSTDTGGDNTRYAGVNFVVGSDNGTSAIRSYRTNSATNYETGLAFLTNPPGGTQTPSEKMRITNTGLGIFTSSPGAKLHIFNSTATGTQAVTTGTNLIIESATSSYLEFRNTSDNGTSQGILFVDNNLGGYVGFTNASTDQMFIGGYAAINLQVGTSNSFAGKTTIASLTSSGVAVTGAITATGNITAYYSDDRLKTKLGKIENALDKICSLEGFYYEANDLAQSLGYKAIREVGISAQSVQSVLPEIVKPAPIDSKYLTIHYERTVPLIIEAIKELRNEINSLKK